LPDDILRIEALHTTFRTEEGEVRPVRGVDLAIGRGEMLGLVGESGSGKSVTAHSIMRLIPRNGRIAAGRIEFGGIDLAKASESEMCRIRGNGISMIFQEPMTSLNPVLRIGDQVAELLQLHRGMSRREALGTASGLLQRVGIPDAASRLKSFAHEMSGGQRQRVMIAMALACQPQLIIADEPTTALDVTIQAQILDLLRELSADYATAMLLITHDLAVVSETASRVAVMYAGQIVELAAVDEVFGAALHPYTQGLMRSILRLDQERSPDRMLPAIAGSVPNPARLPVGCAFQERCPQVHERCHQAEPPFAEVRPRHFARCWLHVH
jgi:oligopeptide/dipeptide ABC transporter ATP-binding protein